MIRKISIFWIFLYCALFATIYRGHSDVFVIDIYHFLIFSCFLAIIIVILVGGFLSIIVNINKKQILYFFNIPSILIPLKFFRLQNFLAYTKYCFILNVFFFFFFTCLKNCTSICRNIALKLSLFFFYLFLFLLQEKWRYLFVRESYITNHSITRINNFKKKRNKQNYIKTKIKFPNSINIKYY